MKNQKETNCVENEISDIVKIYAGELAKLIFYKTFHPNDSEIDIEAYRSRVSKIDHYEFFIKIDKFILWANFRETYDKKYKKRSDFITDLMHHPYNKYFFSECIPYFLQKSENECYLKIFKEALEKSLSEWCSKAKLFILDYELDGLKIFFYKCSSCYDRRSYEESTTNDCPYCNNYIETTEHWVDDDGRVYQEGDGKIRILGVTQI